MLVYAHAHHPLAFQSFLRQFAFINLRNLLQLPASEVGQQSFTLKREHFGIVVELPPDFRFAFRATFNTPGIFGHEIQYAYNRTHLVDNVNQVETGMAIHQGGYNFLVYATHEGKRVRPFGTGGFQFNNYVPPGAWAASP